MVNEDIKRATDYVAQIVWRLETLQYRSRFDETTGETKRLPTKIRRFANGIPRDIALPVLHVLATGSPYTGKNLFNGEGSDEEFTSTGVYIRKDVTLDTGSRKDATYTIVQDLRLRGCPDDMAVGDTVSCSRESYSEYKWEETTAELPSDAAPEQGVTWQVTDITRSSETDLFSYRIRKTVAITQHTEPVTVQCDRRKTVTLETWNNVYGNPETGFEFDDIRNSGLAIDVPACSETAGETVSVRVSQNEDCTYQISVERTVAHQGFESEYLRYKDRFRTEFSDTVDGEVHGLGKTGVEASGGKITRYESHQNDDGTWRNQTTVTTEQRVTDSDRQVTVTPRFTSTRWTDTSVGAGANASVLKGYYGSYKSTKTPGGLFTNEYVTYDPSYGTLAKTGDVTIFARTLSDDDTIRDFEPGVFAESAFAARDGKTFQKTYTKDDTTGVVTRRVMVRTELSVDDAVKTVTNTLLGSTLEVTHRNLKGTLPDVPNLGTVTYRKTDGGLTDVERRTFIAPTSDVALGQTQAKTVYETRDVSETVLSQGSPSPIPVEAAGGGRHSEVSFAVDPQTGVSRATFKTTKEKHVPVSSISVSKTLRNTVTRTVESNSTNAGMGTPVPGSIGTVVEKTLNPGGSVTITTTTKTVNTDVGTVRSSCSQTAIEHTDVQEIIAGRGPMAIGSRHAAGAGDGRYHQVEYMIDDDNVVTRRDTTVQETSRTVQKLYRSSHLETTNQEEYLSRHDVPPKQVSKLKETCSISSSLTKGGNYNVVSETVIAKPSWWEDTLGVDPTGMNVNEPVKSFGGFTYKIGFRNCEESQVNGFLKQVMDRMSRVANYYPKREPFINRMINEFGLYDGSVGFNAREDLINGMAAPSDYKFSTSSDYTRVSIQVIPNSDVGYFSSEDDLSFVKVVQRTKCHLRSGRGDEGNMEQALGELSGAVVSGAASVSTGPNFTYNIQWETIDSIKVEMVSGETIHEGGE